DQGLVFASDSRTSAGVDDVSIYSKMHRFDTTPDRFVVLLSAGNLATTQAVNSQIERDLGNPEISHDINGFSHLDEVAAYIGEISARVQGTYSEQSEQNGFGASFILGGQIGDHPPDIFLIYPAGNYIAASHDKPFLQVGETKYGKPILDRIIDSETSLERAGRCALVSMDASMRSNLSVGPPIELLLYSDGAINDYRHLKFDAENEYMRNLSIAWSEGLRNVFLTLPRFDWESSDPSI
ncbi:MAG: peptidase, partial [Wenzhouxiangellaceae bacterium]